METLIALDWPQLLDLAVRSARSLPAKTKLSELKSPELWAQDIESARHRQAETREAFVHLKLSELWQGLEGLADPSPTLDRLNRGAVLEIAEVRALKGWMQVNQNWHQAGFNEVENSALEPIARELPHYEELLRYLDRMIAPDGEIAENATPKLSELYSQARISKRNVEREMQKVLSRWSDSGVAQEKFTDIRDGRHVIPVRISAQGRAPGTIYGTSSTKQTVFIEPEEVTHLGNELRRVENDILQEKFRILQEISDRLRPKRSELEQSTALLIHWDAVAARARISERFSGKPVQICDTREFNLPDVIHPLLHKTLRDEEIISNSIRFGGKNQALLLTGPNTGGKTVLLKTLGLAAIAARVGFPFPCRSETDVPKIPFFDSIYADVGDAQSLESSVSSFSGHVLKFKEIDETLSDQSLVLLDELNSATDPEEGAALSIAFLDSIMERGALIVSTTHDPRLKLEGSQNEKILLASMAFDESDRRPSYQLLLGTPGRSRALETAERLGLSDRILSRAKALLSEEHLRLEDVLANIETETQALAQLRVQQEGTLASAKRLEKEWQEKNQSLAGEIQNQLRQEFRRLRDEAQGQLRQTLKRLDLVKTRKQVDQTRADVNQFFQRSEEAAQSALKEVSPEVFTEYQAPLSEEVDLNRLKAGDEVFVSKWKGLGKVVEVKGSSVQVSLGKMQLKLKADEIKIPPKKKQKGPRKTSVSFEKPEQVSSRLDLRGKRFDVAMVELERYLDEALRAGLPQVTVVHGIGTGALREGSRQLLSRTPFVKSFADGGSGNGGFGATVVELNL